MACPGKQSVPLVTPLHFTERLPADERAHATTSFKTLTSSRLVALLNAHMSAMLLSAADPVENTFNDVIITK